MPHQRDFQSMSALVAEWQAGGLSQKEFCGRHDIKLATFAYWRKKCKTEELTSPEIGFHEILPLTSGQVEIRYPNGVVVSLPQADVDSLKALVRLF